MGATKTKDYSQYILEFAGLAKALGHPARLAIIEYLATANKCITGDIINELPLSQPTVSQHLRELKNVGLIQGQIEGSTVCYCLNVDVYQKFNQYCAQLLSKIHQNNCC